MSLGSKSMRSILDAPEAEPIEILNVSEITWEDGGKSESITTSSTNALFQERTETDFLHLSGDRTDIDAVIYIDPSETIGVDDRIIQSNKDVTFEVQNFVEQSSHTRVELREVL